MLARSAFTVWNSASTDYMSLCWLSSSHFCQEISLYCLGISLHRLDIILYCQYESLLPGYKILLPRYHPSLQYLDTRLHCLTKLNCGYQSLLPGHPLLRNRISNLNASRYTVWISPSTALMYQSLLILHQSIPYRLEINNILPEHQHLLLE
jgi:hypothetical protein